MEITGEITTGGEETNTPAAMEITGEITTGGEETNTPAAMEIVGEITTSGAETNTPAAMEIGGENTTGATKTNTPAPALAPASAPVDSWVAWEGCSVLLDINDGDRLVFARLSPNAWVKIGDKKCSLTPLIGCRFGSLFSVEAGPKGPHLVRCVPSSSAHTDATSMQETVDSQSEDKSKDNRALIDNNTAQSLSSEDIEAMRREGVAGDEIIEALIANSSTFGKKTTFSQEKYKLKKQKKYAPKILLRRPFSRSICEGYFKKYPTRIGFLRVDALSLLLSMANVSAYSDVLVVDMIGGILTGAVAERIGGTGYVCNTYFGAKSHSLDIVRMFNFSSEVCSRVVQAPYSDLCFTQNRENEGSKLHEGLQSGSDIQNTSLLIETVPSSDSVLVMEKEASQEAELSTCKQSASSMDASTCANGVESSFSLHPCVTDAMLVSNASTVCKSVTPGRQASPEAITSWKKNGFTSLIVAAPEMEVGNILKKLLPLLSYSAPFAVYHQYLQPLSTCMHKLQASRLAIGLQISEPWLREYQVLPSRTHPHMQMSGSGGYILSGIRICNNEGN